MKKTILISLCLLLCSCASMPVITTGIHAFFHVADDFYHHVIHHSNNAENK